MTEVFRGLVHREPNLRAGLVRQQSAVTIEPPGRPSITSRATVPPALQFGAASILLGPERLSQFADLLPNVVDQTPDRAAVDIDGAAAAYAKLFSDLQSAFNEGDIEKLDDVATAYLKQHSVRSLSQIDRFSREAFDFFKAYEGRLTDNNLETFAARFSQEEMTDHLRNAPALASKLMGQLTAAVVQKNLGQQPFDVQRLLVTVAACSIVAIYTQMKGDKPRKIPGRLVQHILGIPLQLAEWIWLIDPCKLIEKPVHIGDLAIEASPLRRKINAVKEAHRRESAVTSGSNVVAGQGRGEGRDGALPDKCDCNCAEPAKCLPPDPCCAEINYYVTDTYVLHDRVIEYTASDLAYVENVMANERRERVHSLTRTVEDYTETETTLTESEERDQQVTDRFSVKKEMEKQFKANLDVTAKYDAKAYSLEVKAGLSSETTQKEAREQLKESVSKAVSTIQTEVRTLTSRRVTTEDKEVNTHGFEPDKTPNVGKFFYVSKVMEGQVYGYGKRLTVELLIPSPAALYEHLEFKKMMAGFIAPCVPDVVTVAMIETETYLDFLKTYCFTSLPAPPVEPSPYTEVFEFAPSISVKQGSADLYLSNEIIAAPPGYFGSQIDLIEYHLVQDKKNKLYNLEVSLDGGANVYASFNHDDNPTDTALSKPMHFTGSGHFRMTDTNLKNFSGRFTITWTPLPIDLATWKKQVADSVNKSNRDSAVAAAKTDYIAKYKDDQKARDPFVDKEILMAEVKRAAIYMMCEEFERDNVMSMRTEPCGYPEIVRSTAGAKTWGWYFWERAFDWNLMSFMFYDYFWNDLCKWPDKFYPGHPDFMFNAFLRAGFMRVMIPAGIGMDEDVLWYIKTKEKWGKKQDYPRDPGDPRWVNVIEELKWSRDCYQNDREGMITGILDSSGVPTNQVLITGTNRYWNVSPAGLDQSAIDGDVGRQIFIAGIAYAIQDIQKDQNSPPYSVNTTDPEMNWIVTLERLFEGQVNTDANTGEIFPQYPFAVGAEIIGAPFRWEEPTNLVWLGDYTGDHKDCLPTYPIRC